MSRRLKEVGTFTLTQPKMRVSDPSYDKDTYCTEVVDNCKTGKWIADISTTKWEYEKGHFDERATVLFARHEDVPRNILNYIHFVQVAKNKGRFQGKLYRWSRQCDNIGVDSGQAGFFDEAKYMDNSQFDGMGKFGYGDEWYSNACDLTVYKEFAGILADCGVNCRSGFGDGCYTLWIHKGVGGIVDAMALFFLPENYDEF